MAKMSITFDGFNDLAYQIDKAGGDLHAAVDEALSETQHLVQYNVESASVPYSQKGRKGYATGKMYDAIIDEVQIDWSGTVATVKGGFSTKGGRTKLGFMHSIFIMYGTPRIAKDQKVYNAIKGTKTKKEIAEMQQSVMEKYINLGD